MGVKWKKQREVAVMSALALRQQFSVHGDVLERVEVFKYLGRLFAQDDDEVICAQLRKARAALARVGQVLWADNVPPPPSRRGEVLQGGGPRCATLRQRNVGPLDDRSGKSRGVPHPCSLPDGGEA